MKEELRNYIKSIVPVTEEELVVILSCFKLLKAEKNELLVIYGQEATRYLAFENNFATALCSFISNEPSLEFIQALEPTELLYISSKDFYHLLEIIPAWEKF